MFGSYIHWLGNLEETAICIVGVLSDILSSYRSNKVLTTLLLEPVDSYSNRETMKGRILSLSRLLCAIFNVHYCESQIPTGRLLYLSS